MKRRDFFKTVTGFVAGVFAAFVPKTKANLNNLKLLPSSVRKRSGTKFIAEKPIEEVFFVDYQPRHPLGTCFVAANGLRFRYTINTNAIIDGQLYHIQSIWYWVPENEFLANPPQEYLNIIRYHNGSRAN